MLQWKIRVNSTIRWQRQQDKMEVLREVYRVLVPEFDYSFSNCCIKERAVVPYSLVYFKFDANILV